MDDLQALVSAILNTHVPRVRAILASTPEVLTLKTGFQQSPLALAKDKGHRIIETAIARHLDVAECYTEAELQRLLVDYLHEVSEHYFAAGWMDQLEYEVWSLVQGDPLGPAAAFQHMRFDPEHRADLVFLAQQTGCWATWSDQRNGGRPLPVAKWVPLYAAWKATQRPTR